MLGIEKLQEDEMRFRKIAEDLQFWTRFAYFSLTTVTWTRRETISLGRSYKNKNARAKHARERHLKPINRLRNFEPIGAHGRVMRNHVLGQIGDLL